MVLGINVEQDVDVLRTKMTTLPFSVISFVIFDSDYALISSPLCRSATLWNILLILCRAVEQDKRTWRIQK